MRKTPKHINKNTCKRYIVNIFKNSIDNKRHIVYDIDSKRHTVYEKARKEGLYV